MVFSDTCPNCFKSTVKNGVCESCGYCVNQEKPIPQKPLAPFTILHDRYMVGRPLGAGGFGITYLCLDIRINQRLAMKEYYPLNWAQRSSKGTYLDAAQQHKYEIGMEEFRREIHMLRSLPQCPYIVRYHDNFDANGTVYFVMEYVDGNSLKAMSKRYAKGMPYEQLTNIMKEVALGLSTLHHANVLHRDVSPENILIAEDGRAKLIDFGAAQPADGNWSTNIVLIKPGFSPPEQYNQSSALQRPWSDIYAFGCTFYYMYTGIKPPESIEREKQPPLTPISELRSDVPAEVSNAIMQAISLAPQKRFDSIDAFLGAITRLSARPVSKDDNSVISQTQTVMSKLQDLLHRKKQKLPYIEWTDAEGQLSTRELQPYHPLSLGRMQQYCDVVISTSKQLSRQHCILTFDKSLRCVFVEDFSLNGTFLANGQRVQEGQRVKIEASTALRLASNNVLVKVVLPNE